MYASKPHTSNEEDDGISSARSPDIEAETRPMLRSRASVHDIQDSELYEPNRLPPHSSDQQENIGSYELNNRERHSIDSININMNGDGMTDHLRMLVISYNRSMIALGIKDEINRTITE